MRLNRNNMISVDLEVDALAGPWPQIAQDPASGRGGKWARACSPQARRKPHLRQTTTSVMAASGVFRLLKED